MAEIITRLVRQSLQESLTAAAEKARVAGELVFEALPEIILEVPKDKGHGNFAANLALVLAKPARKSPRDVARIIVEQLGENPYVERVEIAGPGFINFHLNQAWLGEALKLILIEKTAYGQNPDLAGEKVQIEFVSANPVGPMNVVNARAAALGDTLGRLMTACGAEVWREYYVNDHGVQVDTLGRSLDARYRELLGEKVEFPAEGYQGEYVYDMARELIAADGDKYLKLPETERVNLFRDHGYKQILTEQERDLQNYGIKYDCWFSERSLHQSGAVEAAFKTLQERGLVYEAEGAVWLKTSEFGDDKDRVLRTADGRTTYFTSDIAYHLNKFERGFHLVIDIWGPDHHGYIPRMKAAMTALGFDPARLEVLIAQQINLLKDGQPFKMSKRRGEFITMEELLEEVGNDAARWFFLMRSPDSHLDFDLDLAKSQSNENPVLYVQYAHARIHSIFLQATPAQTEFVIKPALLEAYDSEEWALIEKAAHFPDLVSEAARRREPHIITGFLLDLAGDFHSYYNRRRFISEDLEQTQSRLAMARALGHVFAGGLTLLGVSAPERM
jgi:arginyl-tRNA synthetase